MKKLIFCFVFFIFTSLVIVANEFKEQYIFKYNLNKVPESKLLISKFGEIKFVEMLKKGWIESTAFLNATPEEREQIYSNRKIRESYDIRDNAIIYCLHDGLGLHVFIEYSNSVEEEIEVVFVEIFQSNEKEEDEYWEAESFVFDSSWHFLRNKPMYIDKCASSTNDDEKKVQKPPKPLPGYGHSGKLEPYNESKSLKEKMAKYNLTSGWFKWNDLPEWYFFDERRCPVKELPYLLYSPKNVRDKKVPMVLYFGGLGELGTDLEKQFRQTTVFEKLTSEEFQKKHPCYVFAPMLPENATIRCASVKGSSNLADLTCDAMYALINKLSAPAVDTNRLYTTGLSWGGVVSFELACSYPGRFAANVPVSCYQHKTAFQEENPGNYWLLNNDNLYPSEKMKRVFKEITEMIKERGGEFRYSTFPDEGHDAWTKAWKEDAVWEWMFSKTADGKPVSKSVSGTQFLQPKNIDSLDILSTAICTINIEPIDEKHRPKHAADGLDATCFVSSRLAEKGDYWQIEFAEPIKSGIVCVKSGTRDGRDFYIGGVVEVSRDGKMWTKAGVFSKRTGESNFRVTSSIKYLRVIHTSQKPSQMVLREISVN